MEEEQRKGEYLPHPFDDESFKEMWGQLQSKVIIQLFVVQRYKKTTMNVKHISYQFLSF